MGYILAAIGALLFTLIATQVLEGEWIEAGFWSIWLIAVIRQIEIWH